jgi:hypothetical protein
MRVEAFENVLMKKWEREQIERNTVVPCYDLTTHFAFYSPQLGKLYHASKATTFEWRDAWLLCNKPRFHFSDKTGEIDVVGVAIILADFEILDAPVVPQEIVDGLTDQQKKSLGETAVVNAMTKLHFPAAIVTDVERQTQGCDVEVIKHNGDDPTGIGCWYEVKTDCNLVDFGTGFLEIRRPRRVSEK